MGRAGSTLIAARARLETFERICLFDGDESGLDFSSPNWGPYAAFHGWAIAANGDYVMAYRRNTQHGLRIGFGSLRVNISTNQGRSWMQKRDEIVVEAQSDSDPYSPAVARLTNGDLYLTYERDFGTATQNRLVYGRRSTDNGRTWGPAIQLPWQNTWWFTSAGGKVLQLSPTRLIAPHYHRDFVSGTSGPLESRYTSVIFQSDDRGDTWSVLADLARDPSPSGIEYEEPQIIPLDDGRIFSLIRSDTNETIFGSWSSDGGATWTTPHYCFQGHGWPAVVQCANGTIVAMSREPVGIDQDGRPTIWVSRNRGRNFHFAGLLGENVPAQGSPSGLAPFGAYMYGDIQEIAPNIIGIASAQDQSTVTRTRLWFTKMAVDVRSPVSTTYKRRLTLDTTESSNRGWNFGQNNLFNGAGSFLIELWLRIRNRQQDGIILRHGNASNTQQQIDLRYVHSSQSLEMTIAASLTGFQRAVTPTLSLLDDEWTAMYLYFRLGTLRWWIDRRPVQSPQEITGSLTQTGGAFPTNLTSPVTSDRWTLGTNENAAAGTGLRALISECRLWENPADADVLASIDALYNFRVPRDPAEVAVGLPTAWLGVNDAGLVVDLRGRLSAPTALNSPTISTFYRPAHGYLDVEGRFPGGL